MALAHHAESVVLMSEHEARACVRAITRGLEHTRGLLLDLYEREGWRALGYRNWRTCAEKEFGFKQSRVYQLLTAARVARELSTNVESVPEGQLRPLAVLDTAEERRDVWAEAVATAPDGQVTERHVRAVVAQHRPESYRPERGTEPACIACAQFTNPENWFVTENGVWVWAGSDAPPHLRAISA